MNRSQKLLSGVGILSLLVVGGLYGPSQYQRLQSVFIHENVVVLDTVPEQSPEEKALEEANAEILSLQDQKQRLENEIKALGDPTVSIAENEKKLATTNTQLVAQDKLLKPLEIAYANTEKTLRTHETRVGQYETQIANYNKSINATKDKAKKKKLEKDRNSVIQSRNSYITKYLNPTKNLLTTTASKIKPIRSTIATLTATLTDTQNTLTASKEALKTLGEKKVALRELDGKMTAALAQQEEMIVALKSKKSCVPSYSKDDKKCGDGQTQEDYVLKNEYGECMDITFTPNPDEPTTKVTCPGWVTDKELELEVTKCECPKTLMKSIDPVTGKVVIDHATGQAIMVPAIKYFPEPFATDFTMAGVEQLKKQIACNKESEICLKKNGIRIPSGGDVDDKYK